MYKLAVLSALLCMSITASNAKDTELLQQLSQLNFIGIRNHNDKHEVRVAQNGILGVELSIPGRGEQDLFLRMVSDGRHVVKLIYSDSATIETCEVEKNDQAEVDLFLRKFVGRDDAIEFHELQTDNIEKHFKKAGHSEFHRIHQHSELAPHFKRLVELHHLKQQCLQSHLMKMKQVKAYHKHKDLPKRRRSKRSGDDTLIYPGTKWCGKGSTATSYGDLGEARREDMCCRKHDFCPNYVEGLTTKWGYYNPRITTISECGCDDVFISCLKNLNTEVSNMIGHLYFNVAKTKCFNFKRVRTCTKRKWWGKCVEWGYEKRLEIQEPWEYANV